MSMFKKWLKDRIKLENGISNPSISYKFNGDANSYGNDKERTERELFKLISMKFPEESMDFFHSIAQRDQEAAALLKKLSTGSIRLTQTPSHIPNAHDIVPSKADHGYVDGTDL